MDRVLVVQDKGRGRVDRVLAVQVPKVRRVVGLAVRSGIRRPSASLASRVQVVQVVQVQVVQVQVVWAGLEIYSPGLRWRCSAHAPTMDRFWPMLW